MDVGQNAVTPQRGSRRGDGRHGVRAVEHVDAGHAVHVDVDEARGQMTAGQIERASRSAPTARGLVDEVRDAARSRSRASAPSRCDPAAPDSRRTGTTRPLTQTLRTSLRPSGRGAAAAAAPGAQQRRGRRAAAGGRARSRRRAEQTMTPGLWAGGKRRSSKKSWSSVMSVRPKSSARRKCSMSRARRRSSCSRTKSTSQPKLVPHERHDARGQVGVDVHARRARPDRQRSAAVRRERAHVMRLIAALPLAASRASACAAAPCVFKSATSASRAWYSSLRLRLPVLAADGVLAEQRKRDRRIAVGDDGVGQHAGIHLAPAHGLRRRRAGQPAPHHLVGRDLDEELVAALRECRRPPRASAGPAGRSSSASRRRESRSRSSCRRG